jgi:hypothetical protein
MSKRRWVIGGVAALVVFLLLPGWLKVLAIVALVGIPTAGYLMLDHPSAAGSVNAGAARSALEYRHQFTATGSRPKKTCRGRRQQRPYDALVAQPGAERSPAAPSRAL